MDPYEILRKGYWSTLREIYRTQWRQRGWKSVPRLLLGTFLFTFGYFFLKMHQYIKEIEAWWGERREKLDAVGKEIKLEEGFKSF